MEDPKCGECGEVATQRCSKCKDAWYCSRECQLKNWKQHKETCKLLSKIAEEAAITSRYLNIDKPVTILFFDHFDDHAATKVVVKGYVLDARYEKLFEGDVTEAAKKALIEAGIYK